MTLSTQKSGCKRLTSEETTQKSGCKRLTIEETHKLVPVQSADSAAGAYFGGQLHGDVPHDEDPSSLSLLILEKPV